MSDALFSWRGDDTPESEGAQKAGEAILSLARRLGRPFDAITPDDVVEEASSPESPLHKFFQWDDRLAAVSYRRAQARMLLSSLRYRVEASEPRRIGFVNVRVEGQGRVYVPMSLAEHNADLVKQAKSDALHGLQAWRHRYHQLGDHRAFVLVDEAIAAIEAEIVEPPALENDQAA